MNLLSIQQALRDMGCSDHEVEFAMTSRDAIIPVIEKQNISVKIYCIEHCSILDTPAQLTEAILRATGKWIEG